MAQRGGSGGSAATARGKGVVRAALETAAGYEAVADGECHADEYRSEPLELRRLQSVLQKLLG